MSGTGHMRENEEGIHAEFEVSEPIAGMRLDAALAGVFDVPRTRASARHWLTPTSPPPDPPLPPPRAED